MAFLVFTLVFLSSWGLVSCAAPGNAGNSLQTPATSTPTLPAVVFAGDVPTWGAIAPSIMAELEDWRGLSFMEPVQVTFQPQTNPALRGWYDSETKALVVTQTESEALGRGVLLHELFHALQDQHYDLYQLHRQSLSASDYDKAVTALIEGEAMYAVTELLNYDFLSHTSLPPEGELREETFEKLFLYGAGLQFVQAVRAAGGWDAVMAAFQDPPQATALIFHPDRYLAGERTVSPVAVPLSPGETLQNQTIRGEYEVRLLLARSPATRPLLTPVSHTYVADTLGIVQQADGTVLHRWVIEFTSDEAASTLLDGITTALDSVPTLPPVDRVFVVENSLIAEW